MACKRMTASKREWIRWGEEEVMSVRIQVAHVSFLVITGGRAGWDAPSSRRRSGWRFRA